MNIQENIELYLIAINVITFLTFGADKYYSNRNMWRVPEKTLFTMCAIGGSFGGFMAIKTFRHKTRKRSFQQKFWAIVFFQVIGVSIFFMDKEMGISILKDINF